MNKIYQTEFLKRAQNLQHTGKTAGEKVEAYNPLCGDQQTIYIETDGKIIKNISFEAKSCMVSQVATDMIAEKLIGQNLEAVQSLKIKDVEQLLGTELTPSRQECATLGLSAIKDNLKGE